MAIVTPADGTDLTHPYSTTSRISCSSHTLGQDQRGKQLSSSQASCSASCSCWRSRVVRISAPADLLVPVSAAVIAGAVGVLGHMWISDGVGWGLPLAVIMLAGLVTAAITRAELALFSPLTMTVAALAIVVPVLLYQPLTIALHPPADIFPLADDSDITIVSPADGETITAGTVDITVRVDGGSIGPVFTERSELPEDPEEAGTLLVTVAGARTPVEWSDCSIAAPCTTVSFTLDVEPGEHEIVVEFARGDGTPLAPYVADRVRVVAQ
jgi:hypothetical protein